MRRQGLCVGSQQTKRAYPNVAYFLYFDVSLVTLQLLPVSDFHIFPISTRKKIALLPLKKSAVHANQLVAGRSLDGCPGQDESAL